MTSEKVVSRGNEVSRGIPDLCLVSSNTRLTRETLQSKAELCNKLPFTLRVVTLSLARENASSLRTFEEILSVSILIQSLIKKRVGQDLTVTRTHLFLIERRVPSKELRLETLEFEVELNKSRFWISFFTCGGMGLRAGLGAISSL